MALDTAAKRCSALASRRLPWFRRFLPLPGGTVDQGDRQQAALVYRGILAVELDLPTGAVSMTVRAKVPGLTARARV